MSIELLIGLRLESCRLSKGSYSFELDGVKGGIFYNFNVGTSCYLSFSENKEDIGKNYSTSIWELLETDLVNVMVDEVKGEIVFEFENKKKIFIWGDDPLIDNLVMVRSTNSKQWFLIG
jgi:hypothetical protein